MADLSRTVLITGTSSGIGRACVDAFAARGWNVVATMRTPDNHAELSADASEDRGAVLVTRLDVTDGASIESAFAAGIERFGGIDCVVNNAGYGLAGVFESMTDEQILRQVDTNLLGVLRVCRAAIRHMRPRRQGTIVNVTSMGGLMAFPLYSAYHATKWAVEGFSESLQYELAPLGIRVRIAEPGPVVTEFYGTSMTYEPAGDIADYHSFVPLAMERMNHVGATGAAPHQVARTIVRASESRGAKLRWPTDRRARTVVVLRRILPVRVFQMVVRWSVLRGTPTSA